MKKSFLLQIFYVVLTIFLLSLFWEFVLEEYLFARTGSFNEKIEHVFTITAFILIALAFPTYKGLSFIQNWEQLESALVVQGMPLDKVDQKKTTRLDSMKAVITNELHRRKKMEDAIKNERQKFFNMLDQLPICFHLQADDYTIPFPNKMFKERFGASDAGLCYQVMHNRSKPCEPCSTFKVFDSNKTASSIWTSQDGRTYLTVVTPFEDLDSSTLIMEMAIDITSEQKAKDDLRQALGEQEERVKKRTFQLERSNNALKDFSSFAAHDLKEPLRKIMVFSDRIQEVMDVETNGKSQYYLEGMQRSAERMNLLIDDLLQLSNISSQQKPFSTVDLNIVVAEVLDDLELVFPDCKENISIQSLSKVEAEKTQMYQLFKNLLSNSLKYTKAGETPEITIKAEMNHEQQYLISIQDNGIGFDEKFKEKIFKPFERLHGRNEYSGTGIGLAICKRVVENHNAELEVQSKVNVGTTFTIRFPKPYKLEK